MIPLSHMFREGSWLSQLMQARTQDAVRQLRASIVKQGRAKSHRIMGVLRSYRLRPARDRAISCTNHVTARIWAGLRVGAPGKDAPFQDIYHGGWCCPLWTCQGTYDRQHQVHKSMLLTAGKQDLETGLPPLTTCLGPAKGWQPRRKKTRK